MEDKEIKRLLSLKANPHFQLSPSEMEKVEEWEKKQEKIEIKEPEVITAPEGYVVSDGIGDGNKPAILPKPQKTRKNRKTKNIVKAEDKEIGDIEEN